MTITRDASARRSGAVHILALVHESGDGVYADQVLDVEPDVSVQAPAHCGRF